jgi:hypothetical protein
MTYKSSKLARIIISDRLERSNRLEWSISVKYVIGRSLAYDPTPARETFSKKVFNAVGLDKDGSLDSPTDTGSRVRFVPRDKNKERILRALAQEFTEAEGYKVSYEGEIPEDEFPEIFIPTYSVAATKELE